jgi:hypothetical protein
MRFTHDPPPITVNHISKKKGIHRDSYFVQHALKRARLARCASAKYLIVIIRAAYFCRRRRATGFHTISGQSFDKRWYVNDREKALARIVKRAATRALRRARPSRKFSSSLFIPHGQAQGRCCPSEVRRNDIFSRGRRGLERFDTRPLLADHDRFLGSKALWPCRSLSIPATAPASSARRSGAVAIVMPCSFAVSGQRVADGDTGAVVLILQVIVLEPKSSATGRSLQREATRHVRQAGMAHFPFVSASESLYAWYGNHSRKQ